MLAVPDVRAAMSTFRDRLGIVPVYGGAHARGTHNGLVCFRGSLVYLELFGPQGDLESVRQEHGALVEWLESGGGVWKYAVGSSDLTDEHARMRRARVEAAPIGDHSRARPDGVMLRWQMYRVESGEQPRLWPFVI